MANKEKRLTKKEGRKLKTLAPMERLSPYIMKTRQDAANLFKAKIDMSVIDAYVAKKKGEGLKGFSLLHIILAAYIRIVAGHPALNRFIRGQKIYARNCIEVMLTVKKELTINSPDTVLKMIFPRNSTSDDVYKIITESIEQNRNNDKSDFELTAKVLNYMPGFVLKFAVWLLDKLDYFGLMPRFLTKLSPFHGSLAITSLGSLGIPPVYHHLYNFGNIPLFIAFGAKYSENEIQSDGTVVTKKYVDFTITADERICDGFYFAQVFKMFKNYLRDPNRLDEPIINIKEDIK